MLSKDELRYTLALQRIPNLGDISAKKIIAQNEFCGSSFQREKKQSRQD